MVPMERTSSRSTDTEYESLVKDFQNFMYSIPEELKGCKDEPQKRKKPYRFTKCMTTQDREEIHHGKKSSKSRSRTAGVTESKDDRRLSHSERNSVGDDNHTNSLGKDTNRITKGGGTDGTVQSDDSGRHLHRDQHHEQNNSILSGKWDRNKNFSRLFWIVDIIRDIRELHEQYDSDERKLYEYIDRLLSHVKALDPSFLAEVNDPLVQHFTDSLELRFYDLQQDHGKNLVDLLTAIEHEQWHICFGFYYHRGLSSMSKKQYRTFLINSGSKIDNSDVDSYQSLGTEAEPVDHGYHDTNPEDMDNYTRIASPPGNEKDSNSNTTDKDGIAESLNKNNSPRPANKRARRRRKRKGKKKNELNSAPEESLDMLNPEPNEKDLESV
ncbi:hypothetical protein RNJ44_04037 [Nakaseomyces bracarensis]|uniref:Uncharacterized protein n=1 Tax=Nakaseomyces bracarensis TaxID=273131 RepID=A0ABR4NTR0_9SACH